MTDQPNYLRYLESAKQAELAAQLRQNGFSVETDKQQGDLHFDLVATKDGRTIVYEFKSARKAKLDRATMKRIQEAAKAAGFEFRIIVVNPPPRVNVEINNLSSQLLDHVVNQEFPQELYSLASNVMIDDLADIEISDIRVSESGINVKGTGTIEVTLEYGGGAARDGVTSSDAYPFRFAASLESDNTLRSVDEFVVDTSSFYE